MEELGLRLLALGEELDVVDEQHVDLAVALAERSSPWRSRTDLMNSVTNCSEVTYFTRIPGLSRCMWWPTAISRWVLPRPTPP